MLKKQGGADAQTAQVKQTRFSSFIECENFDAAEPLSWNCKLEDAAKAHSEDMAKLEYFSHTGPDGVQIGERVRSRSYSWSAVGENIAAGQSSVDEVVDGWLSSPGHCANIMSTKFTEMGAARVDAQGSRYSPFWTQVLGDRRAKPFRETSIQR